MSDSTPICRCRVLYLGSAVPRQSKDGLQGIQEPLRSLYPSEGTVGAKGIDSWLSVWSNGILLENVDENLKEITRFFPIESLHYCAAVRQVLIPERDNNNPDPKFLPLDSPFARMPRSHHPPIFAAILRRTTGIKVLECHAFICKREAAANALVRCCFHAYADNSYARQLETGNAAAGANDSVFGTIKKNSTSNSNSNAKSQDDLTNSNLFTSANHSNYSNLPSIQHAEWRPRADSITTLNSVGHQSNLNNGGGGSVSSTLEGYTSVKNYYDSNTAMNLASDDSMASIYKANDNHKIWNGSQDQLNSIGMENPYNVYSNDASTLGRHPRLRQISQPISVPPPPIKTDVNKKKKDKHLLKTSSSRSLSGTLIRPKPMHPAVMQRRDVHMPTAVYGFVPIPAPIGRTYHTVSHRGFVPGLQIPPQAISALHPHVISQPQPVIPAIMHQKYATLQTSNTARRKRRDRHIGIPVDMPIVPSTCAYYQGPNLTGHTPPLSIAQQPSHANDMRPLALSNRKLAASMSNVLDEFGNSKMDNSTTTTGIYRRKGHLNERAFSYSIRQEHRSRSHGSLASLQFNSPDVKKEQEIAQMVAALDLNDDNNRNHQPVYPVTLQRKHLPIINGNGMIYSHDPNMATIYHNELPIDESRR